MNTGDMDAHSLQGGGQDIQKSGLTRDRLRSRFARALHFPDKPKPRNVHAQEMDALETKLKSFISGETVEELQGQLEGQRKLAKRLKGNLQDNRSKLRSVLKDLKAARERLSPLQTQIKVQQKDLFEKSLTIDSQRVEIKILRNEIGAVLDLKQKFAETHAQLALLTNQNQDLKNQVSDYRDRNGQLETENPARRETLRALNAEIETLKNTESENRAEIAMLRSENEAAKTRQSELIEQLTTLQNSNAAHDADQSNSVNPVQIEALNEKLHQASAREAMMTKRLDILRRDLDIVNQTNEMLRSQLGALRTFEPEFPKQVVGF